MPYFTFADAITIVQTQSKIKQLDAAIIHLKQVLGEAEDKRGILMQELAVTEKQAGQCIQKINIIEQDIKKKQKNIKNLEKNITVLNAELKEQQNLLADHLRARYRMHSSPTLIIALNQDNWHKTTQFITLYQYLVRARQDMIIQINKTEKKLNHAQEVLKFEISGLKQLQKQLKKQQQQFAQTERYKKVVLQTIENDIRGHQHLLQEYEQNKKNLSKLLLALVRQSKQKSRIPLSQLAVMRHKLPYPVHVPPNAIQKMNQGVTFFGNEGTPVSAIYPGKVVFSDWLKGYGLLMIIDHGNGFMSLYAHNQALFKSKGAMVEQGEQIATIGHSGGIKQNGLYFEIRQRGKTLPPMQWLV